MCRARRLMEFIATRAAQKRATRPEGVPHASEQRIRPRRRLLDGAGQLHRARRPLERHPPRTAVLGWLAFVLVAFASARRRASCRQGRGLGNGDSARPSGARPGVPDRARRRAGAHPEPQRPAGARRAARRADELVGAPVGARRSRRSSRRWSRATRGSAPRTAPRRCVTFQITGDPDTAQDRVAPALAATAAVQRGPPEPVRRRVRRRSANKAITTAHPARLPAGRGHLAAGDAR